MLGTRTAEEARRAATLVAVIRDAFRGVTRGEGTSFYASAQLDGYVPREEIVESPDSLRLDPGTNWEAIPAEWITGFGANGGWSFMDAEGFRYYLPAVMMIYLNDPGHWVCESLIYQLCLPEFQKPEQFAILTVEQSKAVWQFLSYAESWYWDEVEYGEEEAALGLQGYWKRFAP